LPDEENDYIREERIEVLGEREDCTTSTMKKRKISG